MTMETQETASNTSALGLMYNSDLAAMRKRRKWTIDVVHVDCGYCTSAWVGDDHVRLQVPEISSTEDYLRALHELGHLWDPKWPGLDLRLYHNEDPCVDPSIHYAQWLYERVAGELRAWKSALKIAERR